MCLPVTTTVPTHMPQPTADEARWSLFEESGWMDAVSPGGWSEVVVSGDAGATGRMVLATKRRLGLAVSVPPPLTPHQGPWLRPVEGAPAHCLARQIEVLDELLEAMPPLVLHRARLDPSTPSTLPWQWRGYRATIRYTYEIPAERDENTAWGLLRQRPRRAIRRAHERLGFRDAHVGEVEPLVNAGLVRAGEPPLPPGLVARIDAWLGPRGMRNAIAAVDEHDSPVAVAYFVHDTAATYYLLGGRRDDVPDDGAPSALIWRGMALARTRGVRFDFEGSMVRPIESFFRSFGAVPRPYAEVMRAPRAIRAALVLAGRGAA
jgi:hypothetical protein